MTFKEACAYLQALYDEGQRYMIVPPAVMAGYLSGLLCMELDGQWPAVSETVVHFKAARVRAQ